MPVAARLLQARPREESSQAPRKAQALLAKLSPANFTAKVYNGRSGSHAGLLCGETNIPQGVNDQNTSNIMANKSAKSKQQKSKAKKPAAKKAANKKK